MNLPSIAPLIRKNLKRIGLVKRGSERAKERKSEGEKERFPSVAPSLRPSFSLSLRPAIPPSQIAEACGITIRYETLPFAFGRVIYLAEASLQPSRITVNTTAIAKLAEFAAQAPADWRDWFTAGAIREVVIAHELYHIMAQQASSLEVEPLAHAFAQWVTGIPFSPYVYEAILKQVVRCQNTMNII